jgi:Glycosyltransferase family 87
MPGPLRAIWLFVGLPFALLLSWGLVWHIRPATHPYRDLTQDWLSARCYFDGQSIYTRHRESVPQYLGRVYPSRDWNVEVNAHPPASVLVLLPLALLPHDAAALLWNLVSVAMLFTVVWIVMGRWGLNCDVWYSLAASCFLTASTPMAAQGALAQLNGLLVLLVALSWVCDRNGKQMLAGGFVGLAAAMKLYPAFLLLYFAWTRRWRVVAVASTVFLVVHVAAVLVFGSRDVLEYIQQIVPEVNTWSSAWLNCSVAGFWYRLFDVTDVGTRELWHAPQLARIFTFLTCGAIAAAVGWGAWRAQHRAQRDLAFAACVVGMLLVSPITWDHSLLMLIVPVCIVWYYLGTTARSQLLLGGLLFVPSFVPAFHLWRLFLGPAALPVMERLADPWKSVTILAIVTYCLLGLLAMALWGSRRNNRPHRVNGELANGEDVTILLNRATGRSPAANSAELGQIL